VNRFSNLKVALLLLALANAGAVTAFGQSLPVQVDRETIQVSTHLVQVNVLVRDKNGPVTGLTKDDFVLQDRGKTQAIAFFAVEMGRSTRPSVSPMPLNVFTNRPERKVVSGGPVTIVLLDEVNTSFEDQVHAKAELLRFIEAMDPRDRIAIYTLGSRLHVLTDFTSDPTQIQRALLRHRGKIADDLKASKPDPSNTGNAWLDALTDESNAKLADLAISKRTRLTLAALQAIAHHVERVPGRKNLIWLSGDFPFAATRVLSDANVAVYPVDARGLVASTEMQAATKGRGNIRRLQPTPAAPANGAGDMLTIADETGGRPFNNRNGLDAAIRKALDDSAVSYTLGFYQDSSEADGKYHELNVRVDHKGVDVRHRKGYVSYKDTADSSGRDRQSVFSTAAWSPLESTQIPLSAKIEFVNPPKSDSLRFSVIVDLRGVRFTKSGEHWTGDLEMHFLQKDKDDELLDSTAQPVHLDCSEATYKQYRDGGVAVGQIIELKSGVQTVRVVVLDRGAAEVGSLIVPVSEVR
jgi:VWFA-related protein